MTRVVIDVSVLASATVAHPESPSARVLSAAKDGEIEVVVCDELFVELERALSRRYFVERLTTAERSATAEVLRTLAIAVPDPVVLPLIRDPNDDYLVALARSAGAEAIVTGDRDLLDHAGLTPPAITPRDACERFGLP